MNRTRMHVDHLRRLDPVTLEISVAEPLRRPLVQLSVETVSAMMALADVETIKPVLRKQFAGFSDRMIQEIADLPDIALEELIQELGSVEPAHVPMVLRNAIASEIDPRPEATKGRIRALLGRWESVAVEPITLGTSRPVIMRTTKVAGDPENRRPRAPAAAPRASSGGSSSEAAAPKQARVAPAAKLIDEDRHKWVVDQLLERLADYMEQGLREDVLVAGVRHRARADYPDLTPNEVVVTLKELQTAGRVRHSAGRWKRVLSSW